jgi:DNA polymerase I-like protein with 3'-5' exonuclease and polymerase domains
LGKDWTPADVNKIRKDAKHPDHDLAGQLRNTAKNVFYGSLNMQSPATLQCTSLTAPEPIPLTLEDAAAFIHAWRETYAGLYAYQRRSIKQASQSDCTFNLIGQSGNYGHIRGLTGRRLFLLKHWTAPTSEWPGKWGVKGTDAVAAIWLMTEADIIKHAMTLILKDLDAHPEWDAVFCNMAHDELDIECDAQHAVAVATCVQTRMQEAMRWGGIVDIPVDEDNADPTKMICTDWSEK